MGCARAAPIWHSARRRGCARLLAAEDGKASGRSRTRTWPDRAGWPGHLRSEARPSNRAPGYRRRSPRIGLADRTRRGRRRQTAGTRQPAHSLCYESTSGAPLTLQACPSCSCTACRRPTPFGTSSGRTSPGARASPSRRQGSAHLCPRASVRPATTTSPGSRPSSSGSTVPSTCSATIGAAVMSSARWPLIPSSCAHGRPISPVASTRGTSGTRMPGPGRRPALARL